MAVTFAFNKKIAGANTGGGYGSSIGRIQGPGPGVTGPTTNPLLNSIVVGSPNEAGLGAYSQIDIVVAPPSTLIWQGGTELHETTVGDEIGTSVDLSGTTAILGAIGNSSAQGLAYIFNLVAGAWVLQQTFSGSDSAAGDEFGSAVSIDGSSNQAAVGATANNANRGAVYVFNLVGGVWTQAQKIVPGDISTGDFFGSQVLLLGVNLFAATIDQAGNTGAVYWYQLVSGVWTLKQKLTGPAAGALFGTGIAFDGSTLVIGASGASSTGKAFVYTLSGGAFTLLGTLVGSDSAASDQFGSAVAVQGSIIAVGARDNLTHGAVYVFQSLIQTQKIVQADATGVDQFGTALQLYNGTNAWLAVGASGNAAGIGAVYFYLAPDPSPFTAQLAFMGVRRVRGKDPLIPKFEFRPKPYIYDAQIVLTNPAADAMGNPSPAQTLIVPISNYDFEVYEFRIRYRSAAGAFQDPAQPYAKLWIYDPVGQQISNLPILDLYINGLPLSKYVNGALVPVLLYPNQSQIRIDFYSVVKNAGLLPLTCFIDIVGVQRQPCA
jgi:FG-GAP repeat protein